MLDEMAAYAELLRVDTNKTDAVTIAVSRLNFFIRFSFLINILNYLH